MNQQTTEDELSDFQANKKTLKHRRNFIERVYWTAILASILIVISAPYFYARYEDKFYIFINLSYLAMALMFVVMARVRRRQIEEDIQEIDFHIDLEEFQVPNSEKRAEKLLRINSYQLRRYYDMNLSHNNRVFGLGIFCILLGLGVVAWTIYIIMTANLSLYSEIIIGAVGSAGSILTNYIAAIYLKMHSSASENLKEFHGRLVETHELFLGNLLVSQIEDDNKRWETLSTLAINLSGHSQK